MSHWNFESDITKAWTPPASFYTDPLVFAQSKDKIFAQSWQFLTDTESVKVPGQIFPCTVLDGCLSEPVIVTRDVDDQLHCISNVCTHRGMIVAEGTANVRHLRCRYHGRRFQLDGKFQSMPEFDGVENFPAPCDDLQKIPMALWGPLIFASLNPIAALEHVFGPMIDRVGWMPLSQFRHDPTRAREYMIRCHWSLYVDNYLEGFHIPYIHAALNSTLDYGNYTNELFEHGNLQLGVSSGGEHVFDLPSESPDFGRAISAYYFWIFPNLMFNFYPWGLSINVVRPLGPDLTKVNFIPYVWDSSKLGSGAGGDLDRVEREDEAVVELVQAGMRSRVYRQGRYSPAREQGTHQFHGLLHRSLCG